jgi:hypothetical protein
MAKKKVIVRVIKKESLAKKRGKFSITESYEIITPESAREGDVSESGWIDKKGMNFDSVEEASKHLCSEGVIEASASFFHKGIWYITEGEQDMYSGSVENRHFFVKNASEKQEKALYNRLKTKQCIR